ncbi:MAG: DUF4159 domain-containing protein [Paracoccaceae bacterium]|nr:DUF4159 domain-containing protein [Paracoccaceae bacterium]
MFMLGPLGFLAPWLLLGLTVLPILWLLLRAVPPAPIRRQFPGVVFLLGLTDDDSQSDKTPWLLMLLRMLAVAAVIVGFAGPILNPKTERTGSGPLLILLDGSWADARDWSAKQDRMDELLGDAERADRTVAVVPLTDVPEGALPFQSPSEWRTRIANLAPNPWEPSTDVADWANGLTGEFETYWMSDGVDRDSRDAVLSALETRGPVTVFESPRATLALRPAQFEDGEISVTAIRDFGGVTRDISITAHGLDPAGNERALASVAATFDADEQSVEVPFDLPPELRNRVTRFELDGVRTAGAVTLTDDALRRREVALIAGREDREGLELLSPLHYLEQALEPTADLIDGSLTDILLANPDVLVFADVATLTDGEQDEVLDWLDSGGLLLRFAGPRLAASDISRTTEDPLMPVRLRVGGRSVGGAMSWGEPKTLAPFTEDSPFLGLRVPADVTVTAQVMAQPDPNLSSRVIAELTDGTPLVTRKSVGEGQIILFHVTANAEWSSLPLSGLFVQMLERMAVSSRPSSPSAEELEGTTWAATGVLDAFGRLNDAANLAGITGARLAEQTPAADMPPGLYAGDDRAVAVNVTTVDTTLARPTWPARITVEGLAVASEVLLKGWLIAAALALLAIDVVASLAVSGRLLGPRATTAMVAIVASMAFAPDVRAQSDADAIVVTSEVVLGYVVTGDSEVDQISEAGLRGLSRTLFRRTSIEPADPIGVDLDADELAFFPFLYWPITGDQALPSRAAYSNLNRYLRSGGMILFDTRDADTARFGGGSPEGRRLQAIARPLDIPALEPIPSDHVLTRTFYLLQDFPGRYASRDVWVEAAPADAQLIEGMPFRNLNDGVTPVVIGGNDWARAWAVDQRNNFMFPVGRGNSGERQREIAYRFGVNLIMHVLTGNYKSDQVHVPDLLDRLGQ